MATKTELEQQLTETLLDNKELIDAVNGVQEMLTQSDKERGELQQELDKLNAPTEMIDVRKELESKMAGRRSGMPSLHIGNSHPMLITAKVPISLGGKINLGNYSAIDLAIQVYIDVPSDATPDEILEWSASATQTAREIMGHTLKDVLTLPDGTDRQAAVSELIPRHMQNAIKNNPFAVWLLDSTLEDGHSPNHSDRLRYTDVDDPAQD